MTPDEAIIAAQDVFKNAKVNLTAHNDALVTFAAAILISEALANIEDAIGDLRHSINDLNSTMFGQDHFKASIRLHQCDSRMMPVADETGDFTITSPPYWDLEDYGDEPEQIGLNHTYEQFLVNLTDIARENFRCLKPGAFCCWCVNDFRKDKRFYSYHEHTAQVLRSVGFTQHDTAITDLGNPLQSAFASQVIEYKVLPKRHEYCLIFKKL